MILSAVCPKCGQTVTADVEDDGRLLDFECFWEVGRHMIYNTPKGYKSSFLAKARRMATR